MQVQKKKLYLCGRNKKNKTMTAKRRQEVLRKQQNLFLLMLQKAGVTKRDIYSVAERRWVNSNLDLLSAEEQQQYADVLAL